MPLLSCGKITLGGSARPRRTGRARGITDPYQAVSFGPHPGPELEALCKDTFRALEITDEFLPSQAVRLRAAQDHPIRHLRHRLGS